MGTHKGEDIITRTHSRRRCTPPHIPESSSLPKPKQASYATINNNRLTPAIISACIAAKHHRERAVIKPNSIQSEQKQSKNGGGSCGKWGAGLVRGCIGGFLPDTERAYLISIPKTEAG